jgi:hypothetical protein
MAMFRLRDGHRENPSDPDAISCNRKGWQMSQPFLILQFQLLAGCGFLLFRPTALDGFGNTLPPFRGKISLLLSFFGGFWGCWGGSDLLGLSSRPSEQGTRLRQLRNLMIDLGQNL